MRSSDWSSDVCSSDLLDEQLKELQHALIDKAEAHAATVMPGFTHLQPAQPVTFGHHMLAYVEMVGRDRGRLADCRRRSNESPLGRSEEHTSELQSLMRISYAVFCL